MASGDNARITVVIACFNYGDYLGEAVASALGQAGGEPHVVVVDDGSTDPATHRALDALPGSVRTLRQANAGVARARNAGLEAADTPYVFVLDADDRIAPGALARLREHLDARPGLGYAYGRNRYFGEWEGVLPFPPFDAYRLLHRHSIGVSALVRREVFEATGGFDPDFTAYEDWELWVNALAHGWRGERIDAVTCEYRRHAGSKHDADWREYRRTYRRLRSKHADLYAGQARLARESGLGLAGRAVHRLYWGPRPLPMRVERFAHDLVMRRRGG